MAAVLDPRNVAFRWRPATQPARLLTPAQRAAWEERGSFLLEDAFDAEEVRRALREIDPLEAEAAAFLRSRPEGKLFIAEEGNITFVPHLVLRSRWLRSFCSHPVFQALAFDLVGPDVRLYWDQAVYKKTQRPRSFPWHQDNGYRYVEPQQYLTCWLALSDATPENGCPWVVPGMHRRGTLRHWMTGQGWCCLEDPPGAVPVPARAGSIVVFSSLTPHATGPNRTGSVRKAYIVQFAPAGAVAHDPNRPPEPQDDPQRQFWILRGGEGVAS